MEQPDQREKWRLDKSGLESLLNAFHPDREQASQAYEALRQRLIRFFEWNHTDCPEELADETLDRLARRLSAGECGVLDPNKFGVGIARLLLKEHWRKTSRRDEAFAVLVKNSQDAVRRKQELDDLKDRADMLEECLQSISESNRTLLRRYFSAESRTQIQERQRLAKEYGISLNALRNRVMRIRMEVERKFRFLQSQKLS